MKKYHQRRTKMVAPTPIPTPPPAIASHNQLVTIRDNTTIPLQCAMLSATNYLIWVVKLKAIFNVHDLWELLEPPEGAVLDTKKNNTAITYLYQAIPEELVLQVDDLTMVKEIWDFLKARFVGVDRVKKARLQTLRNEFEALKMKEGESIDDFIGKLCAISIKATQLGESMKESILVRKLLDAVPNRFIQIVASIEQYTDLEALHLQ